MEEITEYDKYINEIRGIARSMQDLSERAFVVYKPIVDDICSGKIVEQNELEHLLDWLVSICISDEMLELFKKVCRRFYKEYPEVITDYIMLYKEMYEEE